MGKGKCIYIRGGKRDKGKAVASGEGKGRREMQLHPGRDKGKGEMQSHPVRKKEIPASSGEKEEKSSYIRVNKGNLVTSEENKGNSNYIRGEAREFQ